MIYIYIYIYIYIHKYILHTTTHRFAHLRTSFCTPLHIVLHTSTRHFAHQHMSFCTPAHVILHTSTCHFCTPAHIVLHIGACCFAYRHMSFCTSTHIVLHTDAHLFVHQSTLFCTTSFYFLLKQDKLGLCILSLLCVYESYSVRVRQLLYFFIYCIDFPYFQDIAG